jgi:hypothetical protein
MAGKTSTIKEYLVSLGFTVDAPSQRRWEDALKLTAVKTEKFAKDVTLGFLAVSGAFAAIAAGVTAGTISMMSNLAKQDLGYQMLARRMFMGTESARKMQIALDTLGVSLQDVIFGPPELRERYKTLVEDQDRMIQNMGGFVNMEIAMRRVRDVAFEFTRMGPELQMFGIALTEDVLNKLFGGSESLEQRLKEFNAWFQSPQGFVHIADVASNVIAPALRDIGKAAVWAFDKVSAGASMLEGFLHSVGIGHEPYTREYFKTHPGGYGIEDLGPGGGGIVARTQRMIPWIGNLGLDERTQDYSKSDPSGVNYDEEILKDAVKLGIPAGLAMAIADKESGINPWAKRGSKGEIGMFQLMPDTIKQLMAQGIITDPNDPLQNIWGGLNWLKNKPGATWEEKARQYNGSGPDADAYQKDVLGKWRKDYNYLTDPDFKRQSYSPTIHVGGIHITQPGATQEQIKKAVQEGIDEAAVKEASRYFAAVQGSYA